MSSFPRDLASSNQAADLTFLMYVWIICFYWLLSPTKFDYYRATVCFSSCSDHLTLVTPLGSLACYPLKGIYTHVGISRLGKCHSGNVYFYDKATLVCQEAPVALLFPVTWKGIAFWDLGYYLRQVFHSTWGCPGLKLLSPGHFPFL